MSINRILFEIMIVLVNSIVTIKILLYILKLIIYGKVLMIDTCLSKLKISIECLKRYRSQYKIVLKA